MLLTMVKSQILIQKLSYFSLFKNIWLYSKHITYFWTFRWIGHSKEFCFYRGRYFARIFCSTLFLLINCCKIKKSFLQESYKKQIFFFRIRKLLLKANGGHLLFLLSYNHMTVRWKEVEAQMVMGGTLRTLNSRVCGLNPIAGSIHSFNGVFPGLGLLHSGFNLSHNLTLTSAIHGSLQKSVVFTGWLLEMKSTCASNWF